jgi:hypothetical protein
MEMPMQFSFGSGLLRTLVSLGFLGCLIAEQTRSTEAAMTEPPIVTSAAGMGVCSTCKFDSFRSNCSDFLLSGLVKSNPLDKFEVALEDDQDSIGIFRVDVEQLTFGIDRVATGPEIASTVARNTRPNISPPLLV